MHPVNAAGDAMPDALLLTALGYRRLVRYLRAFKRQFGMAPSECRKQGEGGA